MKPLSILKDSFRETLDCKTLWVLLVISTILILLCWGVSFTLLSPEEALKDIASGFNVLVRYPRGREQRKRFDATYSVTEARKLEDGEYSFRLTASPAKETHKLVRHWNALDEGKTQSLDDPVPDADRPTDFELQKRYLTARFREQQLMRISIEPEEGAGEQLRYRVTLKPGRPELLRGAYRIGILFGAGSFRLPLSPAVLVSLLEALLASVIAGWVGIIFSVVVTASFVPDMLQKGRVDLILSKPISRAGLLVYKYLGGLLYVFFNALYLVGGCWLALAVRSNHWNASFLWSVPVLTLFFAILYSFSVWVGVLTRSPISAVAATLGLWFASFGIGWARGKAAEGGWPPWAAWTVDAIYYVLPKTSDLDAINGYLIARGNLGAEETAALPTLPVMELDWTLIFVSSGAFLVFFLAMSCLSFSRRDY